MRYKVWNKKENNTFVVRIEDEDYNGVLVEISDLKMNDSDVEFEFEFALEEKNKHLCDDIEFQNYISNLVGDILIKSITNIVEGYSQQKIAIYETMLLNLFKEYNKQPNDNETCLETIGKKSYYVTEEDDRYLIQNIETNKKYYFDNKDDMDNFIRILFKPNIIV